MKRIIFWMAIGTRGFDTAMIACVPPLAVVIWIGWMGA